MRRIAIKSSHKRNRPEDNLQRAVAEYLTCQSRGRFVWFAVPNGGWRSKTEAAILKGLGVRPGVSDLVLLGPGGRVYFIELKAPIGRQSDTQKQFQADVEALGAPYRLCRTLDEVVEALKDWGLVKR